MTVQTQSAPTLPATPAVGGPGHTADHATIASLLAALQASVASIQGTGPAFLLAGGNTSAIPGSGTNLATVTVQPVNRDGSPDILDFYYGSQKIFSLNGYGEPRVTAAALTHVAEVIYALSGQTADVWQVQSPQLAVLARVGPAGDASFAGPVSRQVGGAPAAWQHPALQSGWTAYAGRILCVKLTNDNMVQITGQLVPGSTSDGTTVAALPSGFAPLYRPEAIRLGNGYLEAETTGNLNVYSVGTITGHVKIGGRYPLDAR